MFVGSSDRRVAAAFRAVLLAVVTLGTSIQAPPATGRSAVLLEAGDDDLRSDLKWLADRGIIDVSISTWPLPLDVIRESLAERRRNGLSRADQDALRRIEAVVERQSGAAFGVLMQANTGSFPPTDFQQPLRARGGAGVYAQYTRGRLAVKLQANALFDPLTAKQDDADLGGSYLAANLFGQVLYVGQLDHFWGPGNNGSLIWSNAATPIPGIGLRRGVERPFQTRWLSWLGPWTYEVFLGEMQNYTAVPGTRVANLRGLIRPIEGLELGAAWFEQWGGEGYRNSLRVLLNPPNDEDPYEPNNVLTGVDLRYTARVFGSPVTVYGQGVAEDEAGSLPYKWFMLAGLELKHAVGDTRLHWYLEAADTMAYRLFGRDIGKPGIAYAHGIYLDGLYHDGLPTGHYVGGDGKIVSGGILITPADSDYRLRYSARALYGEVNPGNQTINQAFAQGADIVGCELAVSASFRWIDLRAGVGVLHDQRRGESDYTALLRTDIMLDKVGLF